MSAWPSGDPSRARPGRRRRRAGTLDNAGGVDGLHEGEPGAGAGFADAPAAGTPEGGSGAGPADPEAVARQICLRMLASAPRTRAQLATALRRRRVPEEAAEAVLGRFAEVKLIDDATFASAWVESRHHGRGLSGRALAAELRDRGVASGDIQAAVARLDPEQEVATAR